MAQHIGRKLSIFEIVHHIDQNHKNNDIKNLKLMTREDHSSIHGGKKKNYPINCKRNRISPEKIQEILKLHKQGLNYSEIGKILSVSDQSVRRYILISCENQTQTQKLKGGNK